MSAPTQVRVMATSARGVWAENADGRVDFYFLRGTQLGGGVYPCALGDLAAVDTARMRVIEILPRANILIRSRRQKSEQPIAAHVSMVCVCVSFTRRGLSTQFVDRVVAGVRQQGIPVCVLVSKKDLMTAAQAAWSHRYAGYMAAHAGCDGAAVLNFKDEAEIRGWMADVAVDAARPVVAMIGPSGAGKSTLIQGLTGMELASSEVNVKTGKGRHVTTQPQLYFFQGVYYADCPGIKTWFPNDQRLFESFEDLWRLSGVDCSHPWCDHHWRRQPDCPIAGFWRDVDEDDAVLEIGAMRYQNYCAILDGESCD